MALRPLKNAILFVFTDDHAEGKFIPTTRSGILLTNQAYDHQSGPRWGRALAVGPEVDKEIKRGSYILISALRWTKGFDHDGIKIWKTNDAEVLAVSEFEEVCYQF